MAKGVKIKGLDRVLSKLKEVDKVCREEVDSIVEAGVRGMNTQAQRNLQSQRLVDNGTLIGGQQVVRGETPKSWAMINPVKYAPFHEFGTGGLVVIPKDWEAIAAQFKGKTGKIINIRPRPFFIPAFNQVAPTIVRDIEDAINDALT